MLVNQGAGLESVQRERRGQRVGPGIGDGVGKDPSGAGRGLESTGAPAAIHKQIPDRGQAHDRRGVGRDVDDPGPGPEHVDPAEDRKQFQRGGHLVFDDMKRAALGVGRVRVAAGAHHQFALVRLAQVDVHGTRHHDAVEDLLDDIGHQCLERRALDWQVETGHLRQQRRTAGADQADSMGADSAPGRDNAGDPVAVLLEAGHFAVLDQVDAEPVGGPGQGKYHGIMPGNAAPALQGAADDRVADVGGDVDEGAEFLHRLGIEAFGVDAVQQVREGVSPALVEVRLAVGEVEDAPLVEQHVVVELLAPRFPEFEPVLVEGGALISEVVGPNHRGVSDRVPVPEPGPLHDRDVGDAVVLGQVIGGRQPVQPAPDDDDVIGGFGVRIPPQKVRVIRRMFIRIHGA